MNLAKEYASGMKKLAACDSIAVLLITFSFFVPNNVGEFIKFGPCLFGWKISCPDTHIKFYLYTRKNKDAPQEVAPTREAILKSNFDARNPNKVIIHGYNSDVNLIQLIDMKQGYLEIGDFNVWFVDWEKIAAGPCYPVVVGNLNYVGTCVAQLIDGILNVTTASKEKAFHVIGFSMGAHVAAYTANNLRPYKLSRITGLDPALPLFTTTDKDRKLDQSDAEFVDVLHTDALVEGKAERCGHIDFYMNGGLEQPGCWNGNLIESFRCNHHRAPAYFAESITSKKGFWGWPCKGFFHYITNKCPPKIPDTLMGEYCKNGSTGYYIVHTAAKHPYAIGRNYTVYSKTKILVSRSSLPNDTELITYSKDRIIETLKNNSRFPEFENQDDNNGQAPSPESVSQSSVLRRRLKSLRILNDNNKCIEDPLPTPLPENIFKYIHTE